MSGYYLWPWLPIALISVIWLGVGYLLLVKIFVFGLIGYINSNKSLFPIFYMAGCILFWPFYLVWFFWGDMRLGDVFFPKIPVWKPGDKVACEGKDGLYEVLCIARHYNFKKSGKELGHEQTTTGAGTSRGETLTLKYVSWERQFYYVGFTHDDHDRIFYRDTVSEKIYHRTVKDFNKRMVRVK